MAIEDKYARFVRLHNIDIKAIEDTATAGLDKTEADALYVPKTDSRLTDTRTPKAHKSTHATGGSDALTPSDIGALDQATADGRYVNTSGDTMLGALTFQALDGPRTNQPSNKTYTPDPSHIAQAPFSTMWHDLLAFNRINWTVTQEINNGTTWTAQTVDKRLFSMKENQSVDMVDGTTQKAIRWTFQSSQVAWSGGQWLVIAHTYNASPANKTILVESSADGITWTTRHTSTYATVAQPVWHFLNSYGGDTYFRVTVTWLSGGAIRFSSIRLLTTRWGDQGQGRENQFPYWWDETGGIGVKISPDPSAALTVGGSVKLTTGTVYNLPLPINGGDAANKTYVDTAAPAPAPSPGVYYFPVSPSGMATSNALGNNTLRIAPWVITKPWSLARIGAEITAAGEAGSTFRPVIYADNGSGYPGAILFDGGGIPADVVASGEKTITQTLQPGIYWIGGVIQGAPTTQPTIRVISGWNPPFPINLGNVAPVNVSTIGYSIPNVTGAPPSSAAGAGIAGSSARIFIKTA